MNTQEVTIESTERMCPTKKIFIFDERFCFYHREDAESVLKELRCRIDRGGFVSIYSLCLLVILPSIQLEGDIEQIFTVANMSYGWIDLRKAFVTYTSDGYRLILPTPIKNY